MNSLHVAIFLVLSTTSDHDGIPVELGKGKSDDVLRQAEIALEDLRWRITGKVYRGLNKELPQFLGANLPVGPAMFIADRLDDGSDQWKYLVIELIDHHKEATLSYLRERFGRYSATQKAHIYYQLGRLDLAGFHDLARRDASSSDEVNILNAPIGLDGGYTLGRFAKQYARKVPER